MNTYRKLGIRIRRQSRIAGSIGAVEIFDVESGQQIGNFSDCKLSFPINGAIEVEAKFYPEVVDVIEEKPAAEPIPADIIGFTDVTSHSSEFRQVIPRFADGGPITPKTPHIVGE